MTWTRWEMLECTLNSAKCEIVNHDMTTSGILLVSLPGVHLVPLLSCWTVGFSLGQCCMSDKVGAQRRLGSCLTFLSAHDDWFSAVQLLFSFQAVLCSSVLLLDSNHTPWPWIAMTTACVKFLAVSLTPIWRHVAQHGGHKQLFQCSVVV